MFILKANWRSSSVDIIVLYNSFTTLYIFYQGLYRHFPIAPALLWLLGKGKEKVGESTSEVKASTEY